MQAAAAAQLQRDGVATQVIPVRGQPEWQRIIYDISGSEPLVSVVIPTRDRADLLITSADGVLNHTAYPRLELLIVDNGTAEPDALALLDTLAADDRVRILRRPGPFNWSVLNNAAANEAAGEVLVLLNNDVAVLQPDWLTELVSHALQPCVGAVGAKLLYQDGRVQHAGLTTDHAGIPRHLFRYAPEDSTGAYGMLGLAREVWAVTGACLAIPRRAFFDVGGLNEALPVAYNDVDLCLRLTAHGYRIIWTPWSVVEHREMASRPPDHSSGRRNQAKEERNRLLRDWGCLVMHDPFLNPNLHLVDEPRDHVSAIPGQTCIWSDVDDLFRYARHMRRPTGIQRVAFELNQQLWAMQSDRHHVRFVRHATSGLGFIEVGWREVEGVLRHLTSSIEPPVSVTPPPASVPPRKRIHHLLTRNIPDAVRIPLGHAVWFGRQSIASLKHAVLSTLQLAAPEAVPESVLAIDSDAAQITALTAQIRPNDMLLTLGSSWSHPDYATLANNGFLVHGARLAVLVHDLIPLRRPEWFAPELVHVFRDWFATVIPLCSTIFTVSQATATDVLRCAAERNLAVPAPRMIRIGSGFGQRQRAAARSADHLPKPGSYVLTVSTLEVRKNHALLLRVWRQMLDDLPREQVPTLVLAGRIGWLVGDLIHQLHNSDDLDGTVVLIEMASDAEIEQLYRGCLFTIFPSLYEGWGLPVTESLAFGKPCLAANNSSLPEAGGNLARYFDAGSVSDAYTAIRAILADRTDLAAWQDRIVREYCPQSWQQAAETVFNEAAQLAQSSTA
jgi:GT2 family glycosyltransferase/glycosyltransferase involved in cell wall biosynthesis